MSSTQLKEMAGSRAITTTSRRTVRYNVPIWKIYKEKGPLTPPVMIEVRNNQDSVVYWKSSDVDDGEAMEIPSGEIDSIEFITPDAYIDIELFTLANPTTGVVRVRCV